MDLLSGEPPPMSTGLPDSRNSVRTTGGVYEGSATLSGMEDSGSVKAPEEHLSTSILEARAPAGQVRARQSLRSRVTLDRRALRIESRYPIIGTHPKVAVVIFEDAAHCIARQAIPLRVRR